MTISSDIRREVRRRADFTCEFCGISLDQQTQLLEEQRRLLEEQRFLLQLLLGSSQPSIGTKRPLWFD